MAEDDRVVLGQSAQLIVDGVAADRVIVWLVPFFLVPAPAGNPVALRGVFGSFGDHGDDLVPVFRPQEIEVPKAAA